MNLDQQRAAFEAWYATKFVVDSDLTFIFYEGCNQYEKPHVDYMWWAYQAALASPEVNAWKKDAQRLDFITAPESAWFVQWEKKSGKPVRFRMIDDGDVFGKWHDTARQAIDAAMEKQK